MPTNEWRAVPDIWRSSADKYGDIIAVMDPYHDPPTNMTYKQVSRQFAAELVNIFIDALSNPLKYRFFLVTISENSYGNPYLDGKSLLAG